MTLSTRFRNISTWTLLSGSITIALLLSAFSSNGQITAGTYQVGPTGTYATLGAAVAAYNGGISGGAVIFQLQSTYTSTGETFPIAITASAGASATNTLTIEPAAGASPVITGNNANGILKLSGASYVTINGSAGGAGSSQNLTLINTNTAASATVVWIASTATVGTTHCMVENCVVTGAGTASTVAGIITGGTTVGSYAAAANSNDIYQNNAISNVEYGMLMGGTTSSTETGVIITGNQITTCGYTGINIDYEQSCQITNNTISNFTVTGYTIASAIYISYTAPNLVISGNNIGNINNNAGAYVTAGIYSATTTTASPMYIYNNYIWNCYTTTGKATALDNGYGILLTSGGDYGIYDNTIYQGHNQTLATGYNACMYIANAVTNLTIEDNIFDNAETVGNSYAIYSLEAKTGYTLMNYNDYVGATGLSYQAGAAQTTIAAMQGATIFGATSNTNSITNTPTFISPSTGNLGMLYAPNVAFIAGTTISTPAITTDIVGSTRLATPTIGAYEIPQVLNDAGVSAISTTATCGGSAPVNVTVSNYGTNTINYVTVNCPLCATTTQLYSTPIAVGGTATVSMGNYNFVGGANVITAYTSAPNGASPDGNPSNDSKTSTIYQGLSGTYTIPGSFPTLTAAVAAYNGAPICGNVTFQLTSSYVSGAETFPITINNNTGASAGQFLTIEPASGATPTITGSSASEMIQMAGANYVVINGAPGGVGSTQALTITNTNTSGSLINIANNTAGSVGSTYCTIENCVLAGPSGNYALIGVAIDGNTLGNQAAAPNTHNTVSANTISNFNYGLYMYGTAAGTEINNTVTGNTISNNLQMGMEIGYEENLSITNNTINNMSLSVGASLYGIYIFSSTTNGLVISGNIIGQINNTYSNAYGSYGIFSASTTTTAMYIYNNYIWDCFNSLGANATTRTGHGIYLSTGTNYYIEDNTVYQGITQSGGTTACLYIAAAVTALTVKDNIFDNGETGTAYAVYCAGTKTNFTSLNYNDYVGVTGAVYINATTYAATTTGLNSLWTYLAETGSNASIAFTPVFTSPSTGNLGLTFASDATLIAGITPASPTITTDIVGTTRYATPTIGAFEILQILNDAGVSNLTTTVTCSGSGSVTATVTNYGTNAITNVTINCPACTPTSTYYGTTIPINGTASVNIGTYNFTSGPNIISACTTLPNGTTDGNTSNDCLNKDVITGLSGTFTVGAGGQFSNLKAAVNAYNAAPICGPVTFQLTSSYTSSTDTFPIIINANSGVSSSQYLTIEPAAGATPVISGTNSVAMIELYGASYVHINGAAGGSGSTPALTISNTAYGNSAGIYLCNSATTGSSNNVITNCIISGGTDVGINVSGATTFATPTYPNANNLISNNTITGGAYGIQINGPTAGESGNVVSNNTISAGSYGGINVTAETGAVIRGNTISNVTASYAGPIAGIYLSGASTGCSIDSNYISAINNSDATEYMAAGIFLYSTSTTSNNKIYNNSIWNITAVGDNAAILYNAHGILIYSGGGYNIYFNSISLSNNQTNAALSACIYVYGGSALTIENNILSNTETTGTIYGLYSAVANTAYTAIDYNDYYVGMGTGFVYIGGTSYNTFPGIATAFGGANNTHSGIVKPNFVSSSNLDLTSYNNLCLASGKAITGITTDIHGNTRVVPCMGIDEFAYTFASTIASDACLAGGGSTVTINTPAALSAGSYNVTFNLSGANIASTQTAVLTYDPTSSSGTFVIPASLLTSAGATTITITGLQAASCTSDLSAGFVPVGNVPADQANFTVTATCAVTWVGTTSSNWNTASNWNPILVPNSCSLDVLVPSGTPYSPVISTGNIQVGNLTINSPQSITLNGYNLSVCKNLLGNYGVYLPGSGNLVFNGSVPQNVTGFIHTDGVVFNNTSTPVGSNVVFTNYATMTVYRGVSLEAGNVNVTATNTSLTLLSSNVDTMAYLNDFSSGYTGTFTGNLTAERQVAVTGTAWQHMVSSPVSASFYEMVQQGNEAYGYPATDAYLIPSTNCSEDSINWQSPYSSAFTWNESNVNATTPCITTGWKTVSNADNWVAGQGYSVYLNSGSVVKLEGEPNTGNISLSGLTNSNWSFSSPPTANTPTSHTDNSGWSIVGNPYPSGLNISATSTGFDGQVQVFHPSGTYLGTYYPVQLSTTTLHLAPFQAFMVHKTSTLGTATWTFNQSGRTTNVGTSYQFYELSEYAMTIQVKGNGFADMTRLEFNAGATDGFDADYDADKFQSNQGQPTLYTVIPGYAPWGGINVMGPLVKNTTVPLGLQPGADGTFTLSFDPADLAGFPASVSIYLEDKQNPANWVNVRTNNSYTFASKAGDQAGRFALHFSPEGTSGISSTTTNANTDINIFSSANNVMVDFSRLQTVDATIQIYDVLGQQLSNEEHHTADLYSKAITSVEAAYVIVLVRMDDGQVTTKKIFLTK